MIAPPARWRRLAGLIVIGVNLFALIAFTVISLVRGSLFNAVVGAVLVVAVLQFWRRIRPTEPDKLSLWIADTSDDGLAPPATADAVVIPDSDVEAVQIGYQPNGTQEGFVQVCLQLRGMAERPLAYRTRDHGYLRATRTAQLLAERLNVPLRSDASLTAFSAPAFRGRGAILILLIAMIPLGLGGWLAFWQWRLLSWPATDATVRSFDAGIGGGDGMHWFANPKIVFEYRVQGRQYTGTRMNPSRLNYQSEETFTDDTAKFQRGKTIRCWYQPGNPAIAYVVNRGVTPDVNLLIALGMAGIAGYFVHLRWLARCRREAGWLGTVR